MFKDLVQRNRSYRRFYQDVPVERTLLVELVDLARLTPSAANRQPLKYILSSEPEKNALIFPHLYWAGYLKDWPGPREGERPAAYILVLGDREITPSFGCDHGIAAQTILLGAAAKELGGCMLSAVDREKLTEALKIPRRYEILLVLALGKPKEQVTLEPVGPEGNIKYYRDDKDIHHVPKRLLSEVILEDWD